jgi:endonuclease YncB( thermonuclease family)
MSLRSAVVVFAFIVLTSPVMAQSLSGQADVIDVDTIAIRGEKARIRLYGVDGPESQQTCNDGSGARYLCGSKAADALASIIGRNGRVACKEQDRDRYGRIVATCEANGRDIAGELIRQGWAVEYTQYSDGRYSDEENEAQRAKRGLWAGTFVKPWDWRRGERPSRATSPARSGSTIYRVAAIMPARPLMKPRASAGSALRTRPELPDGGHQEGRGRTQC